MDQVNEGSTAYLTVAFLDKEGDPAAPTSLSWSARDQMTGTVLQEDTALVPATSVEITLPSAVNRMVTAGRAVETHVVTVKATYGEGDGCNNAFLYQVKNLEGVS